MRGSKAKALRRLAYNAVRGPKLAPPTPKRLRAQERIELPPREQWAHKPAEIWFQRLMEFLGQPPKFERRVVTPVVVRERRGTVRWTYQRLKRVYKAHRAAGAADDAAGRME